MADVKVDLSGLKRFSKSVESDLRKSGNGPIRKAIKQWGFVYRSFVQERFDTFSKGGGDWKPLAVSTVKAKGHGVILKDTNTLFTALEPTFKRKPGQLQKDIPFGVRVGYGGEADKKHPSSKSKSVADIAGFHQDGGPNLPQREIIVSPDTTTIKRMQQLMQIALKKAAAGA